MAIFFVLGWHDINSTTEILECTVCDDMAFDRENLSRMLNNPSEAMGVELKRWLIPTPENPEAIAKIAKGCIALRNNNGGYLIVGFDDNGEPDKSPAPGNLKILYHQDVIQSIVSKYASRPIEIEVQFVERNGVEYPFICVPGGVQVPVAAKSGLKDTNGKVLIKEHAIYVRSLNSNNSVSSSEARHNDWDRIIELCFDNREADIARFIRRHLANANITSLRQILSNLENKGSNPSKEELAVKLLDQGAKFFEIAVGEKKQQLPEHGAFESSVIMDLDEKQFSTDQQFSNLLFVNNPQITGWPFWVDSRGFENNNFRPYVSQNGWQSLIVCLNGTWHDALDFWRIEPNGWFYHRRVIEDDIGPSKSAKQPLATLDWGLSVVRVAEVIVTGIAFGRAMELSSGSSVIFGFRWSRLHGRKLTTWTNPERMLNFSSPANDDQILSVIAMPLETPESSIFQYVHQVTKPLFGAFGGVTVGKNTFEDIVKEHLKR